MKKFLLIILFPVLVNAQVVYEPLYSDVYNFLSRLSQRGIIEFNDNIKPLGRNYLFEKLVEAEEKKERLTNLEREELTFFLKDYSFENKLSEKKNSVNNEKSIDMNYLGRDDAGRYRLFTYSDDLFKVNASPILGYKVERYENETNKHLWNGFSFYGYLGSRIGYSFDFRDNTESGLTIDRNKRFTNVTGNVVGISTPRKVEYSEARGNISFDWDWGTLSAGKGFMEWGYGEGGKLVLSTKAPSYFYVRLDIEPVSWLSFNYIHGWLASDVVDSVRSYRTGSTVGGGNRILFREKYLASHTLTLRPLKGLSIALGESIVYSDRLEPLYLFPLMFYKAADHYLSKQNNNAGDNAQFFGQISSRNHIPNTHLYATLFIDEIRISGLFKSEEERNQIGFNAGASVTDLPFENLTLTLEYTKVYPFAYNHYIPAQTYENASYTLGHWIGHNGDQFYGSLLYRAMRGLQIKLWGQLVRKGGEGEIEQGYKQPQPPFLFGERLSVSEYGVDVRYVIIHDFFARGYYQYSNISDEDAKRTPAFQLGRQHSFGLAVGYGL